LADHDYIRNFPGLEVRSGRLVLRGVGLIERCDGGYRLSDFGRNLAHQYVTKPDGMEWVRQLAIILLTREPRTRVLVRFLSHPGAKLIFQKAGWFQGSPQAICIKADDGFTAYPFAETGEKAFNLRQGLSELSWWSLGAWRDSPLLGDVEDCELTGYNKPDISLHRIGFALRSPCEVLLHLGVLRSEGAECRLDHATAIRQFGNDFARDFSWSHDQVEEKTLLQLLAEQLHSLRSDTGYVVASELRDVLQAHGIENPDREIGQLESAGLIVIDAESYGQSRHGVGLYSDPRKQLVKLRVVGGEYR